MRHRGRLWVLVILIAGGVAAEWLRQPSGGWVVAAWLTVPAAVAALWPISGWRSWSLLLLLVGLALSLTVTQRQLRAIETRWPEERERRVTAASRHLASDLHSALHRAERLADAAITNAGGTQADAMQVLGRMVPSAGTEMNVAVFDSAGRPWAWAGRHRLPARTAADSFAARASGYYVVLEARRHSTDGRSAVAGVLIWAHPAVPDRQRSLAELFRDRTEVGLTVYPPGTAPDSADVFDYEEPTTVGPRLLFSVQPVPPEQGPAKELVFHRGSRGIVWLVLSSFLVAVTLAGTPLDRLALLTGVLWLGARAPVGAALGLQPLFSPATFYRPLLGPLSASAGALALAGALLTIGGVWLWRRKLPRRWYGAALGVLLLLASPYLISSLGRGITPPTRGVSIGLWLTWQLTLLLSASALIIVAASLFRGPAESHTRWRIVAGVVIAFAAAIIGILVWSPRGAWPDWYTFLWTPALLLVTLPAPRWATILGVALVAGSSAALVTWGAELSGRLQVAQRDIARLGSEPDPLAVPLLERFADQVSTSRPPIDASEMYALWHGSALGDQGYPGDLALWSNRGELLDQLQLDSLDLSAPALAPLVRSLPASERIRVVQLVRTPGVHYVLLLRISSRALMTVTIGPRTALIPSGRVRRLLDPTGQHVPLYTLSLSPPGDSVAAQARPYWRREGWSLRREVPLSLGSKTRAVHAVIDLRGPVPLLVRGVLVVLLNAGVLALLWFFAELVAGVRPARPRWQRVGQSFRIRLAVTLAAFFMMPAVGFAAWSFTRLAADAQQSRDLLITQTLRDAAAGAAGDLSASPTPDRLLDLSQRIDADLALYGGGRLTVTSNAVLEDLGVVDQLMDPEAFQDLAFNGELEVTREGSIPQLAARVGYRVVEPGPPETIGILATPQLASDLSLGVRQLDLAFALLLATLAGVGAAIGGAQIAARTLSRPVAELRRSALALGRGQPMTQPPERPPTEFEPVFAAFERMAHDIRASQAALEEARRRTAAVLATVATGVIGLDLDGKVLIANRQALELVGTELQEGDRLLDRLPPEWAPLAAAVRRFLGEEPASESLELEVLGRRLTLQLASLGPDVHGLVMALNDVTDLSQAQRVLAWGEMARQVAHEIKNPLTPMRLGMQHLRRVYRERRAEFDGVLNETAERILAEIDRLDTIARAFSRFGAPAGPGQPLDRVDLKAVVGEVVQLYRLAEEGCEVRMSAEREAYGAARQDEVKEVVVNLLENARNAGARVVEMTVAPGCIRVADNGAGIPRELLPRVFEPRFSTNTSGSGLGLAIVRRLVESWGGKIEVTSEEGRGTVVTVRLAA